ncbi:MAG: carbohydrate ABC transporter permease [Clostridiales bacterium]|nr:carbohydrate ABC transporter permease [Clostridiales bacterium]
MNKSKTEKIVLWITFVIFALYAISLLYPVFWLITNSLKQTKEFGADPFGFPKSFYMKNYVDAFSLTVGRTKILGMFVNSVILVVGCTLVSVFVPAITGYVVAKFEFPGRKLLYGVAISSMLIPAVGTLTATYQLMVDLRLYNSYIGIIIMSSGGFGFNFVMVYGFFKSISKTYAEAAMLDGAGEYKIFFKVMLPQVKPSLIAIGIIAAINYWNDYFTPYMYLRQHPTIAVGLQKIVDKVQANNTWPQLFAIMLISILPPVAIFIAFQKTIMENTVAGGLKG